jgi:hypothetical protein
MYIYVAQFSLDRIATTYHHTSNPHSKYLLHEFSNSKE